MAVELTPNGTRGGRVPRLPGPIGAAADALAAAGYRRFGERMRIAGLPLLLLTTHGARSGARRRAGPDHLVKTRCQFPLPLIGDTSLV